MLTISTLEYHVAAEGDAFTHVAGNGIIAIIPAEQFKEERANIFFVKLSHLNSSIHLMIQHEELTEQHGKHIS